MRAMYNRVHRAKKSLMLKPYMNRINKSILPKKYDEQKFSDKLVNELHAWIENHPRSIHPPPPNVKD